MAYIYRHVRTISAIHELRFFPAQTWRLQLNKRPLPRMNASSTRIRRRILGATSSSGVETPVSGRKLAGISHCPRADPHTVRTSFAPDLRATSAVLIYGVGARWGWCHLLNFNEASILSCSWLFSKDWWEFKLLFLNRGAHHHMRVGRPDSRDAFKLIFKFTIPRNLFTARAF